MAAFKVGDSVKVRKGVKDPDAERFDMSGWQGRVKEVEEHSGQTTFGIAWDSVTLKNLPEEFIEESEEEGSDFGEIYLHAEDLEPAAVRDKPEDATRAYEQLSKQYAYVHLGEEGRRIQAVLRGVDGDDEMECFETWAAHLKKTLAFPFEAKVTEFQERGAIRQNDRLTVTALDDIVDDLVGVLARVRKGETDFAFPLADLGVIDKRSPNYQPVQDYVVWFGNR